VPTTSTRTAGLAALFTPILLVAGQYLNLTVDRGFVHGIGVVLLVGAIAVFVFVLWGLRARHGGLGRVGSIAIITAVVSPFMSFVAGYTGLFVALGLLGLSVVVLVVGMLRADVLPAVPLVLLAAGPLGALGLAGALTAAGADAGDVMAYPLGLTVVGYLWLGWHLFREPAVDARRRRPGPLVPRGC
jgi:hypothetical protein